MQFIDLSHTIQPDMPLFSPAAPAPEISAWMSHADAAASGHYVACSCEVSQVRLVTSLGTYMDSPFHFYPERATIDQLRLEQLVLSGVVIDCTHVAAREAIGPDVLDGHDLAGKAVLFNTGWSRYWGRPEYFEFPFLTGATAQALVSRGARLTGVDFLVIDDTRDPRRPVHVTLLGQDILIIENLTNLSELPPSGFFLHAVPVKIAGVAAFPVRAYAVL
ncbi:MAG: cyclase family protein [Chloroflexi bacterium]|nr:cyclase family protein [Chloroflexota bacterium]